MPVLGSQRPKILGVMDVPRRQICQRPAALVLELDQRRSTRRDQHGLMPTRERLQLRLLIGADDVLTRVQRPDLQSAVRRGPGRGRPWAGSRGSRGRSASAAPRLEGSGREASARSSMARSLGDAPFDDQAVQLQPGRSAPAAPGAWRATRTPPRRPRRPAAGGKRRGRPARGLSLHPSMPCSQNLRRHLDTDPHGVTIAAHRDVLGACHSLGRVEDQPERAAHRGRAAVGVPSATLKLDDGPPSPELDPVAAGPRHGRAVRRARPDPLHITRRDYGRVH